jgi:spore coat protein B
MHHVKSLSHNAKAKDNKPFELPSDFTYLTSSTFKDLLTNLDQFWVHVNHGPEKVEGVLSAVNDDWATIVTQEEVVRVNIYHIKTLSYGNKLQREEEDNKEKENNNQNKNEKNNKKDDKGK